METVKQKKDSAFSNNTRSDKCGTDCFMGQDKLYFPPEHINARFIKILVKVTCKERQGFAYRRQIFPRINKAKK